MHHTFTAEPGIELTTEIRLRAGLPEDAAALAGVFVSAWRHSYPGVVPESSLQALDQDEIAASLQAVLGSEGSTTVVAEAKTHELFGFCRYGADPEEAGTGHVFSLYVSPLASRRGLGARLLAHAVSDLELRGLDRVTLWVFERNEPARRLYSSFGFFPDGGRVSESKYGAVEIRLRRVAKDAL
jgi:ribosomal protein S18 acetylase RimI-like enzyme